MARTIDISQLGWDDGDLIGEASAVGFAPGEWPTELRVDFGEFVVPLVRTDEITYDHRDFGGFEYVDARNRFCRLYLLND